VFWNVQSARRRYDERVCFFLRRKVGVVGRKRSSGKPVCSPHKHFFEIEVGRHGVLDEFNA